VAGAVGELPPVAADVFGGGAEPAEVGPVSTHVGVGGAVSAGGVVPDPDRRGGAVAVGPLDASPAARAGRDRGREPVGELCPVGWWDRPVGEGGSVVAVVGRGLLGVEVVGEMVDGLVERGPSAGAGEPIGDMGERVGGCPG